MPKQVGLLISNMPFHGIPVHGMLIHGMSLHGISVHVNDTFSTCSWNDMVHGRLHSPTTNLSGVSPAYHEPPMVSNDSRASCR